ncbi:MAG TPA: hypothetical protein PLM01_08050 [Bacteroidales bacterium]|nr:hypothetical protein [Bacteroidales bacterium]HQJ82451.1 hypothetical protein [Bacteroidales bacterium]
MDKGESPGRKQDHNDDPEDAVLLSPGDNVLLGKINDYFKARFDIEDVKNDPEYRKTDESVKSFISGLESGERDGRENEIRRFIRDSIYDDGRNAGPDPEISRIRQESSHRQIEGITAEWVREWHERKRMEPQEGISEKQKEIRDFVIDSLQKEEGGGVLYELPQASRGHRGMKVLFPWAAIAAAAAIAVLFLIRGLMTASDPERLFSRYYEPYYAASLVTRSSGQGEDETLRSALGYYRNHNYRMAAVEFSKALLTASAPDMPVFYLGVTLIELEEFERAFMILEPLTVQPGEFLKDAQWYLGLLSVRTGKTDKARECFESLAGDPGFYSVRAGKILRLLK